jgi:anthranilate phosphoribosyltransferase
MREFAAHVPARRGDLLDTAGTGGGRRTFNVSTTAAIIAAGAGCTVAKHGNRSATGLSGSADLLEALGARIDLGPFEVARCIDEIGFGFMFAPAHHPATRYVIPVRRQLGVRTTFNFLGPLTNPAGATRQLLGVSTPDTLMKMAGALALLGTRHALLVCGEDGVDELSISAPTHVVEVTTGGTLREYSVTPEELGLPRHPPESVPGGDPAENAATTRAILAGQDGAARDLAVLNAGAAIYAGGGADSLHAGVEVAQEAIDSDAATSKLEQFIDATHQLSGPANATS